MNFIFGTFFSLLVWIICVH